MLKNLLILGLGFTSLNAIANVNSSSVQLFAAIKVTPSASIEFQCSSQNTAKKLGFFKPCVIKASNLSIFTNVSNNVDIKLACFKGDDDSIKIQSLLPNISKSCFSGDGFGVVYNTAEELTNELNNLGVTNANQLVSQAQLVN